MLSNMGFVLFSSYVSNVIKTVYPYPVCHIIVATRVKFCHLVFFQKTPTIQAKHLFEAHLIIVITFIISWWLKTLEANQKQQVKE